MSKADMDAMTTVRVKRRTQHAVNTISGMLPKGTTADDVIWDALYARYPDQMKKIESLQSTMQEDVDAEA